MVRVRMQGTEESARADGECRVAGAGLMGWDAEEAANERDGRASGQAADGWLLLGRQIALGGTIGTGL